MKLFVIFVLLCMTLVLCASAENEVVVASGHPDWAPAMYAEGDQIVGVAPDIVTKAFATLDLDVNCTYVGSWANVQELGKRGTIDVIVAAYKTAEREKYFLYSDEPIMEDDISAFSIQNIFYKGPETFEGCRIAVSRGDSYGQKLDNFLASNRSVVTVYDDPYDAMYSLIKKKNDVFLYSTTSGKNFLQGDKKFSNIKNEVVGSLPFYVLVSKQSKYATLMPKINEALRAYAL